MTLQADVSQIHEEIAAKRTAMHVLFNGLDKLTGPDADARAKDIKTANDELTALGEKLDAKQDLLNISIANAEGLKVLHQPVGRQVVPQNEDEIESDEDIVSAGYKSIREMLRNSPAFSAAAKRPEGARGFRGEIGSLALKTLITSADLTPQGERLARIQPYATEERTTVGDLLLPGTTSAQKIEYFEETTFTNGVTPVSEAGEKPEIAIDFTLREDAVRKIAGWVPVTDEMLADVPFFESYIRERLGFMVKQIEEQQLLLGTGVAPAIEGIMNRTGVQTVTGYGMSTIDSILAAITEIRADAFAEPTALIVHPRDWFNIRTSKDTTGNYLLGPATDEGQQRVWGLRIVQTTAITENTGLVGDFRQGQVFRRSGIDVVISSEHSDYFIYNKLAVRAEERLALAVYRPAAFCKIEAIVTGS